MKIVSIAFALIQIKKFHMPPPADRFPTMRSQHKSARVCRMPGYPWGLYVNREMRKTSDLIVACFERQVCAQVSL